MRVFETRRRWPGRPAWATIFWWTLIAGLIRLVFRLVYRARMEGRDRVPARGPIVYIANHQSHFDPVTVGMVVADRPFSGMARASLFDNRILAFLMNALQAIPLKRGGPGDKAALTAAIGELEAGRCVLIFPEGTRTSDGSIGEFRPGVLLLVRKTGAPVVPVALEGAFDIWRIGTPRPKLTGRLALRVGEPIEPETLAALETGEALEMLRKRIDEMRMELRATIRRESGGRFPHPGPGDYPIAAADRTVTIGS